MPVLTYPYSTTLKQPVNGATTALETLTGMTDLLLLLPGSHFFATVYTAARSERVLVTGESLVDGIPKLTVTRGVEGTAAQSWPFGACVRIDTPILGMVCPEPSSGGSGAGGTVNTPLAGLTVGAGLDLDVTNPTAPRISLRPTGVTTGDICGATVNAFGQFSFIPANWPTSCLPTFNPCCDGAGGGGTGAISATSVSFAPTGSIITSTTVGGALNQLEAAVVTGLGSGGGLTSLTAGACIVLSGSGSSPTISVADSGIVPGTYAGFAINACGQVTGYTNSPADDITVTGILPVSAAYDVTTTTYTVSVGAATTLATGVVRLIDEGNAVDPATQVLVADTDVVTWEYMQVFGLDKPLADNFVDVSAAIDTAQHAGIPGTSIVTWDTLDAVGATVPFTLVTVDTTAAGNTAQHATINGSDVVTWAAMLAAATALGW